VLEIWSVQMSLMKVVALLAESVVGQNVINEKSKK